METNYTKPGLIDKIKDHPYNVYCNGKYSKGLYPLRKEELYRILRQLDELMAKQSKQGNFDKIGAVEQSEKSETERDDDGEGDDNDEGEGDDDDDGERNVQTPVVGRKELLEKRKKQKYVEKQKAKELVEKKERLERQKEYAIPDDDTTADDVATVEIQPKQYVKRTASAEIATLKKKVKKILSDDLAPINKEIKRYAKAGKVYPLDDRRYQITNSLEELIEQLNAEINDILDNTNYKDDKDADAYEDYVMEHLKSFIATLEKKINSVFDN